MGNRGTLTQQEKTYVRTVGRKRYESKRARGIPARRPDGSQCTLENDIESTGAEYFAARHFGCEFREEITSGGDGGFDFRVAGHTVESVWLGEHKWTGAPRRTGHLIVDPAQPQRWAEIYVSVRGSVESGFEIVGWTRHGELVVLRKKDFGYGERFAMHINDLYKSDLRELERAAESAHAEGEAA